MSKVVFLGIDGLDPTFINEHLEALPTFARLRAEGVLCELPSTFPPDSIPAWITIFTGEPPDEHGIVESIDYLARNPTRATDGVPSFLRGRTFWDKVSAAGRRVCVVNPFMAYPSWEVRGAMVSGPVFVDAGAPSLYPEDAADGLELPQLGGIVDFPTPKTIAAFLDATLAVTHDQIEFGLELFRRIGPDLCFLNILTADRIQHFLWRYGDVADPTFPGASPLAGGLLAAYRTADEAIARFAAELTDDDLLLVASDHGHGRRPTRMVYIDELLRREGLFDTGGVRATAKTFALDKAKRAGLQAGYSLGQEHRLFSVARRLPGRKALKTSSYSSARCTVARVSRAFGRNSCSGVELAPFASSEERRRVIEHVRTLLLELRDPRTGVQPVLWALDRDDLLSGQHRDRYPDVLFELREGYGVDYGVFGPLFGPDTMHRRISGGHRRNGIFGASSRDLPRVPTSLAELHEVVVDAAVGVAA